MDCFVANAPRNDVCRYSSCSTSRSAVNRFIHNSAIGASGDKHQERSRQELHQPDHAEIEGAAGEIIDLPADRDARDLAGEARQAARDSRKARNEPCLSRAPSPAVMADDIFDG
jgi:hypothetical protein